MSVRRGLTGMVCGALALGGCLDTFVFDRDGAAVDGAMDGAPRGDGPVDSSCPVGEHLCNGTCVDSHAVATCGTLCAPCASAPTNGTLTCDGTMCGFTCGVGYVASSGLCAPVEPPRPVAPLSTSTTTSTLPMFHWALAAGSDGAHVQVYRDRACTQLVTEFNATGSSGAPSVALSGVVFWRLQSRSMGTTLTGNSPVWQVNIGHSSGTMNTSSGTTLDVNGDGYADVAVGAPNAGGNTGKMFLYLGGPTGLSTTSSLTLVAPNGGLFGDPAASAGDVNGDGYSDLIVGAFGANGNAGEAYLYEGGATGFPPTPTRTLHAPDGGYFGESVAAAGDVNGDGYGDVVVGAWGAMGNSGRVYIYFGSPDGLGTTSNITLVSPSGGAFGVALAGAGDVNGDGFGDIVVGARLAHGGAGEAYIFAGGTSGTALTPATTFQGHTATDSLGVSVANAGDVNGDGYSDVLVGAYGALKAFVYLGGAGGAAATPEYTLGMSAPADFGFAVSGAGDVNRDGFADVLVGAYGANSNGGQAFVFLGSSTGFAQTPQSTMSGSAGEYLGFALAGVGDVDRDGIADIIIGAPALVSSNPGHAYFYRGNAAGLGATPTPTTTLAGVDAGGAFGTVARATPPLHRRAPLMCTRTRVVPQS